MFGFDMARVILRVSLVNDIAILLSDYCSLVQIYIVQT